VTATGFDAAFHSIARGFATLRANWPLVPMMVLQQVLVLALLLLGAAVPLAALGPEIVGGDGWAALLAWQPAGLAEAAEDLAAAVAPVALPLAVALLGTAVVWTLAILVFCWFQGGFYGVLLAAERQALPGPPRDWRLFRTWDRGLFAGWARRLMWRYFGFWNLWALAATAWLLAALLLVWAARAAAATWGGAGLLVVGGGGSLALALALLVLAGWGLVAPPDLAREEAGVGRSSRRALALLFRRPLEVGLVVGVFVVLSMVVVVALGGLATPLVFVDFAGRLGMRMALHSALWLLQIACTMAVTTAMNGALAALVVGAGRQAAAPRAGAEPAPSLAAPRLEEARP
jgi:hypothetical protein